MPLRVFDTDLASEIGMNEAILLHQMHYWMGKTKKVHDGKKWFYCTYDSWLEQFPTWSRARVERIVYSLRNQGLIEVEQINKARWNRVNYYTVNYDHALLLNNPYIKPKGTLKVRSSSTSERGDRTPQNDAIDHIKVRGSFSSKTTSKITDTDYDTDGSVGRVKPLKWLEGQSEIVKDGIEDFVKRKIEERDDIRNPQAYRIGIIDNIRLGTAEGFDAGEYEDWMLRAEEFLGGFQ